MNVTNSIIKFVSSLAQKKYRDKEGCFVAEGTKCVRDTWQHFDCRMIIATQNWYDTFGNSSHLGKLYIANRGQMQRMSQFATASEVIAVYNIPQPDLEPKAEQDGINIVLDGIQDPGNLGTIIRLADWYGIRNIFCSKQTVDVYNHKVVQANNWRHLSSEGDLLRPGSAYCRKQSAGVRNHARRRQHLFYRTGVERLCGVRQRGQRHERAPEIPCHKEPLHTIWHGKWRGVGIAEREHCGCHNNQRILPKPFEMTSNKTASQWQRQKPHTFARTAAWSRLSGLADARGAENGTR